MENVMQQMMGLIGDNGLEAMANKIGADKEKTTEALGGIMPTLLGALSGNAQSEQGASGILGALDRDHDGSIFDNLGDFIGNAENRDGDGILKHTLGDQRPQVEEQLSMKTGLQSSQVSKLMQIAGPLIMGYLGKQKRESNSSLGGFDLGGLSGLLGGLTNQADNDTGIDLGDVLNMVGVSKGGGSGIGGMLGGLFGK